MTAFELLRQKLQEQRKIYRDSVSDGSPENYDSYRYLVGVIQGLNIALREVGEIEQLIDKTEE